MKQQQTERGEADRSQLRIKHLCRKSVLYQATDPEASLWLARKTAEAICRQLFIDVVSPNPGTMMLDKLIEKLSPDVLPKHVQVALRSIQHYGNLGVHEQGDGQAGITPQYVKACTASLESCVIWYFCDWLKENEFDVGTVLQTDDHTRRPLTDLIIGSLETTLPCSAQPTISHSSVGVTVIERVVDFWKKAGRELQDGDRVSIEGTLSQYAPLLVGDHKTKRQLHLEFRDTLSKTLSEDQKADINSILAYTAGQMVMRCAEAQGEYIYLGLYHAIVRNSIPIFVRRDYYSEVVNDIFFKCGQATFDARVVGYLRSAPSALKKSLFQEHATDRLISPRLLDDATRPILCIFVDGSDSHISRIGTTKYLDGDIWLSVEVEGREYFRSRFCDLSDRQDVESEAKSLSNELRSEFGEGEFRVLLQFDDQLTVVEYESTEIRSIKDMLFG